MLGLGRVSDLTSILPKLFLGRLNLMCFTLRSANMGISAFISPQGKILKNLQPNEIGNIELSCQYYRMIKRKLKII